MTYSLRGNSPCPKTSQPFLCSLTKIKLLGTISTYYTTTVHTVFYSTIHLTTIKDSSAEP